NARIITRFMGYQPAGNVILFTALESSDLENGRMIQPRTEFSDLAINPELLPDRFLRPASEIDPATVKDGEIRGKIIDVSDYGSFITNVSQEVMEQETVRAPAYQVQIKDYTQTHRYIESLGEVQVDRGDRILLFNNTPALWVVKAYDGMSSDIDAREGDLIYLKPVTGSEEAPAETGAESPRTGNAANSAHGSAPPPSVTIPRAPSEPLPDADRIMRYKPFGNTGLKVSDVSVGGGSLADPMVVAYALDKGMNYFDTAESYGRGASEEAIGQVAKTRRKEMIICTKMAMNGETTLEDMLTRFDQCLARLQTDYADVLMIHGGNPDAVNNPQIHQGFAQLKSQGKLKFSGISCHGPNMTETLWPVVRERKADVILLSYDPVTYPDLPELLKAAEEQGIALVAMKVFTSARGADLPEYVQGKQPFNVAALRWVLSDPFIDTCIPSVTFLDHVDQYVRVSGYPGDGSDDGTAGMPAEQPDDAGGSAGSVITGASDVLKAIPDDLVLTGDTLSFAQEDLWKHINGADQQYIAFGCRSLTVAYFQEASGKDAMTVEVYEMPDASCSFGIYTRQKSRSGPFLDIGVEGYVSGNMLIFHKDRFYVQLAAPDETPASVTRLKNTARAMAAAIPGSSEPPAAFRMFPGDLFSPDTFAYIYDGILGIQGLGNGYAAVARV
ncbi:MAG TPA: aldo/keto reductase, partial [bacterium]|nr:aldo/keto reductase [bacterium]